MNDPLPGLPAVDCPMTTLVPGAATICTADYVTTQADVDAGKIENVATASATPPFGATVTSKPSTTSTSLRSGTGPVGRLARPAPPDQPGPSDHLDRPGPLVRTDLPDRLGPPAQSAQPGLPGRRVRSAPRAQLGRSDPPGPPGPPGPGDHRGWKIDIGKIRI